MKSLDRLRLPSYNFIKLPIPEIATCRETGSKKELRRAHNNQRPASDICTQLPTACDPWYVINSIQRFGRPHDGSSAWCNWNAVAAAMDSSCSHTIASQRGGLLRAAPADDLGSSNALISFDKGVVHRHICSSARLRRKCTSSSAPAGS